MALSLQVCITRSTSSLFIPSYSSSRHRGVAMACDSHGSSVRRRAFIYVGMAVAFGGSDVVKQLWSDAALAADAIDVGLENGRLRGCNGPIPCVSTSAFQSPSRFMPPWSYLGSKDDAYVALLKALERMGAKIVEQDDRYIYAKISPTASSDDVDDLEFLFVGKVVCYRSVSRKTVPDPPFCWWPGCINDEDETSDLIVDSPESCVVELRWLSQRLFAHSFSKFICHRNFHGIRWPRNRGRMEALRDDLGWVPMETDEEKRWVPLLLH